MIYEFNLIRKKVSDDDFLPLITPKAVYDYAKKYLYNDEESWREKCYAIFTGPDNTPKGHFLVSMGVDNACLLHPRTVIEAALLAHATKIVIVHNHPSGNCLPGQKDIEQTGKLKKALDCFDMDLLDHVIIAEKSFFSFSDEKKFNA